MIYDHNGDEIPDQRKPEPHKFGQFVLPQDFHIRGFGGITSDSLSSYNASVHVKRDGPGVRQRGMPKRS